MKKVNLIFALFLCSCSSFYQDTTIDETEKLSLSLQIGSLDKAQSIATENLIKDPGSMGANFDLSDIYYKQGKYDLQYRTLSAMRISEQDNARDFIKLKLKLMQNSLRRNSYPETVLLFSSIEGSEHLQGQQRGKAMEYAAVALCKSKDYDRCLNLLNGAMKFLPGDTGVIDNINIANYMKNSKNGSESISSLYQGYNDSRSGTMLANLVMALIKENNEGQAYKLLNLHYSNNDSLKIIEELRLIYNENNT